MVEEVREVQASTRTDPRYQRVRAQLTTALLSLAATRPAESISVSELTAAAGVSRASFYAHATSPDELLTEVLVSDLRPTLDELAACMAADGADYLTLWRQLYRALLDHVGRFEAVYLILCEETTGLTSAMIRYFEEAATPYVRSVAARMTDDPVTELWQTMAITQTAHGMTALIRGWLTSGMTEDPDEVIDTYLTLVPPWQLAHVDERGVISLHRGHSPRVRRPHRN